MDSFKDIRLSIYWAPTLEDFEKGTKEVIMVGESVDILNTDLRYRVEFYSRQNIYHYINGNGQAYVKALNSDTRYDFIDGANTKNQLLRNMPDVWDSTKAK